MCGGILEHGYISTPSSPEGEQHTIQKSDINNKLRKEDGVLLNLPFPYLQQRHWSFLIICIVFGVLDQLEIDRSVLNICILVSIEIDVVQ